LSRIERNIVDISIPVRAINSELWIANSPRSAVARNVEFRHNSDTSFKAILERNINIIMGFFYLNDSLNVLSAVCLVRAESTLGEVGVSARFDRKAFGVDSVP
jgi:hypothetical protein